MEAVFGGGGHTLVERVLRATHGEQDRFAACFLSQLAEGVMQDHRRFLSAHGIISWLEGKGAPPAPDRVIRPLLRRPCSLAQRTTTCCSLSSSSRRSSRR